MDQERINELSTDEISAIASAATWYASRHARIIAEKADDPSARAVGQRERYDHLLSGLRKLGVRLPGIDALREDIDSASRSEEKRAA